ncbi:hypothetical protein J8Z86_07220 [Yersinia enterocolitica]|uniref:MAE_28990/MAE_18760 family HEPN-like nuclease n=1 Tax=Yersinia enterocolitica TaxID=630 RepID=UPI001C8EFFD8|nr:MAE_28990/MAE_18760 family HEPN-like nuclease [Yersinia enterocolitica]MBX9495869.1 hypothetical protein [Yersinia enterocolitica]
MTLTCTVTHLSYLDEIDVIAGAVTDELNLGTNVNFVKANAMTRSGLVLLCGYFEGFIREMSKEFIDIINDSQLKSKEIPISLLSEHAVECLSKFKTKNATPFNAMIQSFIMDDCLILDSKKLSSTKANPSVDTIENIFFNFGIPNVIDIVTVNDYSDLDSTFIMDSQINNAMLTAIKNAVDNDPEKERLIIDAIELKWMKKTKRRRVGYLNVIDELLKKRNRIAHGEGMDLITPEELSGMTDSIRKLCLSLARELEIKIADLTT